LVCQLDLLDLEGCVHAAGSTPLYRASRRRETSVTVSLHMPI
jgi:hypothetical protein